MSPACLQSIGLLLDFRWLHPLEFRWTSVGIPSVLVISSAMLGVGLLLVHRKSIGKVRWTERSDQKCPDKHRKIIGKLLY